MRDTAPPPDDLPVWARPWGYALLVALISVPRLATALRMGLLSDEAYYALWSMHPGPGYYDHSPGIAWVVALGRGLFGEGSFAIRSVTLALGFVAFALLYRLGRLLFGDARIGALAGYFYAVSVGAVLSFSIATPDGISTLFWLAALWAVAEFVHGGNRSWWLAAGLFAGLGLLSKYTNVLLAPGLLLYLAGNRGRWRWFGLWQLWAGAVLALLMFAPVVWWNATHGWVSFGFQLGRSTLDGHEAVHSAVPFLLYWLALALIMLPPAFLLVATALPRFAAGRAPDLALPLLTSLPAVLFFALHSLVETANPNWLDPVFPPLMLAAAYAARRIRPGALFGRWAMALLRWLQIPLGLAVIATLTTAIYVGELPGVGLRSFFSYGRGWDGVASELSALAQDQHAEWIDTRTYLIGSLVAYAMITDHGTLPVLQTNEPFRYTYAPPPDPALLAAPHLLVKVTTADTPPPLPARENAVPVTVIHRTDAGHILESYAVYRVAK